MKHLDDDELTLAAFGETHDAAQREHLRSCSQCETELQTLSRLVSTGRTLGSIELVQPPESVWAGIHRELGLAPQLAEVPRESRPTSSPAQVDGPHVVSSVKRMPRRRVTRRGALVALAAASLAAGLVAGIVGTSLILRPNDPRVVAEAVLEPFPNWQASGIARVEEDTAGQKRIVVDVAAPDGGLREVWLLDPETSGLISLGLLSGTSGTYTLPDDLDLTRFSVIDVSQEPDDGDPAHSGDSIVRGELGDS